MSNFSRFSRRRFSRNAAISGAGAILLKACGNPPEPGGETATEQVEAIEISPEMMPETTKVVLGYIPIVEAAALAIANQSLLISAIVCARRSETLSSSTRRTGMQMQWSGGLTRCSPGCVEPATQDLRPRLPAVLTPKI